MDSLVRDFDKAFESFSKKIKDKFSKEEPIRNMNSEELFVKFFKIIKFGGFMGIDDFEEEIKEAIGRDDTLSMLFGNSIKWYLDNCGINLPFEFKIFESISEYSMYQLMNMNSEYTNSMNLSPRFCDYLVQEARRKGFIVYDNNTKKINFNKLYGYLENEDDLYLVSEPNELYNARSNSNIFSEEHCKIGDFYFRYNVNEEPEDAIYRFANSLCRYLETSFPKYYEVFSGKVDRLFVSLSKSKNPECARAMNESFIEKIKNKFSFDRETIKMKNVDPLYSLVEENIKKIYEKKISELGGTSSDRDLVSGLMTANKFLRDLSKGFSWHVEILSVAKSDPVFFDNKKNYRIVRSNSFIEEKFASKIIYGKLKRQYRVSKDYFNDRDIYYTIVEPLIHHISNKNKFKIGFVMFEGTLKLSFEDTVELCYKVLSYMRDNLDKDEWDLIFNQINK